MNRRRLQGCLARSHRPTRNGRNRREVGIVHGHLDVGASQVGLEIGNAIETLCCKAVSIDSISKHPHRGFRFPEE